METRIHTVVNPNFGKTNPRVSCWFTSYSLCFTLLYSPKLVFGIFVIYLVVSVFGVQGIELLSKILSLAYTPSGLQYKRKFRGESLPGKPGGTSFGQYAYSAAQALVQRLRRFSRDSGLSRNSGGKSGVSGPY
jgi:hypothetical protein